MLSLQILARIEEILRGHRGNPDLVLADEFDYMAGTSTGAIIAAGLALGKPVSELEQLYRNLGPSLFRKRRLAGKMWSLYQDGPLREALQHTFGAETSFGDARLRTVLLCVLQNTSTDSPWPLSNCTSAKYNDRKRADCNLNIPLWKLVRASTAAPIYFPPEQVVLGGRSFIFQDGGITAYNNPAFIQYLMATAKPYGLGWAEGADLLLSVSVGTGTAASARPGIGVGDVTLVNTAKHLIGYLMNSAAIEQDRLCRFFGDCRHGARIDNEVSDLRNLERNYPARFSYVRYNADLGQQALNDAGLGYIDSKVVRKLDSVDSLNELETIGRLAADAVELDHLRGFI